MTRTVIVADGTDRADVLLDRLRRERLVAVVRCAASGEAHRAALALIAGGIRIIEVTFTTPDAAALIGQLRRDHGRDILVGAGTVLSAEQLDEAHAAGADFAVAPGWSAALVGAAGACGVPFVPGVFTPTEMQQAVAAGVRVAKLFPAELVGPAHLGTVHAVFPGLSLMPTGGIAANNVAAWLAAGSIAVGVGSGLGIGATVADSTEIQRRATSLRQVITGAGRS